MCFFCFCFFERLHFSLWLGISNQYLQCVNRDNPVASIVETNYCIWLLFVFSSRKKQHYFLCIFSQTITATILQQQLQPIESVVWWSPPRWIWVGGPVATFCATECMHSHDGYRIEYWYRYHFNGTGNVIFQMIPGPSSPNIIESCIKQQVTRQTWCTTVRSLSNLSHKKMFAIL